MSPDLFFWYGLVLKAAMTATIVVIVSVAAERSGPFVAALIAALPTAASATYIILAVEHPPAFVAAAAIGSMAANAAVAIFALTYTALAQRQGIVLSIAVATLVWFGIAAVLRRSCDWSSGRRPPRSCSMRSSSLSPSRSRRVTATPRCQGTASGGPVTTSRCGWRLLRWSSPRSRPRAIGSARLHPACSQCFPSCWQLLW